MSIKCPSIPLESKIQEKEIRPLFSCCTLDVWDSKEHHKGRKSLLNEWMHASSHFVSPLFSITTWNIGYCYANFIWSKNYCFRWWHGPTISATEEAGAGRSQVHRHPGNKWRPWLQQHKITAGNTTCSCSMLVNLTTWHKLGVSVKEEPQQRKCPY